MTRRMVVLAIVAFTCVIAIGVWSGRQPQERQLLREVYSPTFGNVNLGAQRLRERGRLPYGDPLLTGTPGAAYGPVFYALH